MPAPHRQGGPQTPRSHRASRLGQQTGRTSLENVLWEDVMRLHKHLMKSIFGKAALAAAVLTGFLLFAGAPSAKANDWDVCNRRVAYAEFRIHQSIVYFGYYSPQADYWRH